MTYETYEAMNKFLNEYAQCQSNLIVQTQAAALAVPPSSADALDPKPGTSTE